MAAIKNFLLALRFNDGCWRALQIYPAVYDEQVFQDFVLSEAKRNKIRLILNLVNNWDAYAGKAQYVTWGRNVGFSLHSNDGFFSDPTLKSYFKSYIKLLPYIGEIASTHYFSTETRVDVFQHGNVFS